MLKHSIHKIRELSPGDMEEIYVFWKNLWHLEFVKQGLDGIDTSISDDLIFSDEILVVRHFDQLAGLILLSHFNSSFPWHMDCSYFKGFPNVPNGRVLALRYFIADPKLRRKKGIMMGHLLLALSARYFLEKTDFDYSIGMPLKENGVHNLVAKFGYRSLTEGKGALKHQVPVEYVSLSRKDVNTQFVDRVIRMHYPQDGATVAPEIPA